MLLPLANWLGLAGSLLLLFAPARDQWLRLRTALAHRRDNGSPGLGKYWRSIARGYDEQRNAWNFFDSLSMLVGASLIGASYIVDGLASTGQ